LNKIIGHRDWEPLVSPQGLQARADLYAQIREYFSTRDVLEVETPIINACAVTDLHIDSMHVKHRKSDRYLQTSPEYAMKRLLAFHKRDIYQLCKVFRAGEEGKNHHFEFTMLEWYRVGWSYQDLINEVDGLVKSLLQNSIRLSQTNYITYKELFLNYCNLDPWQTEQVDYIRACEDAGISLGIELSNQEYQELLLDQAIAKQLPKDRLTFVSDFPAQQAALAKINNVGIAERFELYLGDIELANGFQELTYASEQLKRFQSDNQKREQLGKEQLEIDEKFIAALQFGLPESAGVALGIDRLLMLMLSVTEIKEVLAFPDG
jgi:lysyl-tRNA synthetase class 2